MSGETSVLVSELPGVARRENDETLQTIRDTIEQFVLMVSQVEYPTLAFAPLAGDFSAVAVPIEVRDVNDIRMLFGEGVIKRIQVDASGTAPNGLVGPTAKGPFAASTNIFFKRGRGVVWGIATGAGTLACTLVDVDATGLILGADAVITFS